jgi:hypothetical protein
MVNRDISEYGSAVLAFREIACTYSQRGAHIVASFENRNKTRIEIGEAQGDA